MTWLVIALGGAVGALARYGFGGWVQQAAGFSFPWGTLVVNVLGCVLIGVSMRYLEAAPFTPEVRALIMVGFLASFTTFSTFSYEVVTMLEDGQWWRAGMYAVGSLILGIVAVYAGSGVAQQLLRPRG
jgi:CrcB protein